ncbi:ribulose-bisphosphate carboxylase large subunit family protein [Prosthecomicrobium sp. N25]|uniref:ribulose-bisphosphate carboxylase large subunit family protein n=1 Tax=Prosthecomicrobium sp. N25 TaxID=3129254 RepID=UPI0030782DBF
MSDRIAATYILETADDPARAAAVIAGEQSSGTFVALRRETAGLLERSGAEVEALEILGEVPGPSLPGSRPGPVHRRCRLRLSWPLGNLGPSLPNLVATVAGNLFELKCVAGLRLVGLDLPEAFAARYPGPRHGIAGTRTLAGVPQGPLIGTIVKPSVGLSPEETAEEVAALVAGGIDFVKDDELQADGPNCPFEARVKAVMRVVRAGAERTGRKAMVAFNLTGDLDEMRRRHDLVLAEGGTCVMASLHSVGFVGILELARHSVLPIHGHRNGWGYLSRHPALGFDYAPWQMLWRLAGVDHLHVNGLANKFCEPDDSVVASARAVLAPVFPSRPMAAMPVFSSGQTVRQAAPTFAAVGTTDLIFAAGGGIFGHPAGVKAGVEALRAAWDAAVAGEPLEAVARRDPGVAAAMEIGR